MSAYLSKEVKEGLEAAREGASKRRSRMRVRVGGEEFTILRQWAEGFSLDATVASKVRGLVDIYDGARHISQGLIVATEQIAGEMSFEFKRVTVCADAPALDYERAQDAPVAMLMRKF